MRVPVNTAHAHAHAQASTRKHAERFPRNIDGCLVRGPLSHVQAAHDEPGAVHQWNAGENFASWLSCTASFRYRSADLKISTLYQNTISPIYGAPPEVTAGAVQAMKQADLINQVMCMMKRASGCVWGGKKGK